MTETTEERETRLRQQAAEQGMILEHVGDGYRLLLDCCQYDITYGRILDLTGVESRLEFPDCYIHACRPTADDATRSDGSQGH